MPLAVPYTHTHTHTHAHTHKKSAVIFQEQKEMIGCAPTHKELKASMLSVYQFRKDALVVL